MDELIELREWVKEQIENFMKEKEFTSEIKIKVCEWKKMLDKLNDMVIGF